MVALIQLRPDVEANEHGRIDVEVELFASESHQVLSFLTFPHLLWVNKLGVKKKQNFLFRVYW